MPSKIQLYVLIISCLLIFLAVDWCYIMPSFNDIGKDLFINTIFMIFTITFLNILFDYREDIIWKKVKSRVSKRITKQFFGIFLDLSFLCKRTIGIEHSTEKTSEQIEKRIFITQLEELEKNVELTDGGRNFLLKFDAEYMDYISLIESREQSISNVELKYSKFLSPELVESLMIIQDKLQSISLNMHKKVLKNSIFPLSDKEYLERVTDTMHDIFKQIYKVHQKIELGIIFYPE